MEPAKVQSVQQSFGRCLVNKSLGKGFLDAFYEEFIQCDPRIKLMFSKTNMQKQKDLLREGLVKLMMYANGSDTAKSSIEKLALQHDRKNLNVEPGLYRLWMKSLLSTVRKYDQKCDEELQKVWTDVLEQGIKIMEQAY